MGTPDDKLIAIDVLLEPDRPMADKVKSLNAWLRENYQAGYALDATHMPHVTLLQRFMRARDFDAVTATITKVLWPSTPSDEADNKEPGLRQVRRVGRGGPHRRTHD